MEATKEKHAFTPGPWGLSSSIHEEEHGDQEYYHIIAKKRMSDIGIIRVAKHKPMRTTDEANARLIAAAPDLLAQCKEFEKVLNYYYGTDKNTAISATANENRNNLREVLAKVEGGEG